MQLSSYIRTSISMYLAGLYNLVVCYYYCTRENLEWTTQVNFANRKPFAKFYILNFSQQNQFYLHVRTAHLTIFYVPLHSSDQLTCYCFTSQNFSHVWYILLYVYQEHHCLFTCIFLLQTIMIQNLYRNPNNNSSNPYGPSK